MKLLWLALGSLTWRTAIATPFKEPCSLNVRGLVLGMPVLVRRTPSSRKGMHLRPQGYVGALQERVYPPRLDDVIPEGTIRRSTRE